MSHSELKSLIPWYVNSTLAEVERGRLEAHLELCGVCRRDLELERALYSRINAAPDVEYMPAPSLKKLNLRLDALQNPTGIAEEETPVVRGRSKGTPWKLLAVASLTAFALALGVLAFGDHRPAAARTYYTVTTPAARVPDAVIRAVFVPSITLVELQKLLDEAQLRIVAGPSEAGVYSLALTSARPVAASLAALRRHDSVRFAEGTQPATPVDAP
jgi:hypothetical protein